MINSLSGRFLILTVIFVMIAEVLIFVPSVARHRQVFLEEKLENAQIASLAVLASSEQIVSESLRKELVDAVGVYNVVFRRQGMKQLILGSLPPGPVTTMVDLRDPSPWYLIKGAMMQLAGPSEGVIRVIGESSSGNEGLIDISLSQAELKKSMIDYGITILLLSVVISVISAGLLFLAVRRFMVKPIKRVVNSMMAYSQAPEDARRVLTPESSIRELRAAEDALAGLQTHLTGALKQKERLAQLGGAVAKISHDLRNILTTATLLGDRMERSEDPAVKRSAPKLVRSLSRAVNLCESTLAFGSAKELPPALDMVWVSELVDDVLSSEKLAASDLVTMVDDVSPSLKVRADSEQVFRVLSNLVRNARQAIEASGKPGSITISAREDDRHWNIFVTDTGPGLPAKAQQNLFTPFEGGVRQGGTGLGLVIAAELVRGHGGALELERTDETGTAFVLRLPKETIVLDRAAE